MCSVNFMAVCRLDFDIFLVHMPDDVVKGEVRRSFAMLGFIFWGV